MTLEAHGRKLVGTKTDSMPSFENTTELGIELAHFSKRLAAYNPDSLSEMKKLSGKEPSIELLPQRAAITGKVGACRAILC
jgi:hypothetical protein